ncbi:uncharacterized protein LOC125679180 isoform X2 [Ostrea edulis]|uniref:uncharacterized protein LOC125679180 isoform X2 n=1 Tax=Ostrea edulis TaxID=37623 RepID=UPI0024AE97E4|nr:uncharacterized protein LOC125679180 isoform X2 [Ostrea edulis]
MADEEEEDVQEFSVTKLSGQRVVLKFDVRNDTFTYIKKGDVKHSCTIEELNVTNKNGFQIEVRIGDLTKVLTVENYPVKKEILDCIQAIKEEQASKSSFPMQPGSRIIKEGYLMKKGNAAFEKWARRKVCIKQGVMIYYPENSEKRVLLSPVTECHVDGVGADKINVTVPGRTYSFQIPDSVRDKKEEQHEWIRCIRVAISDRLSAKRKSKTLKQGYLDKQGHATVKLWNERFVKVEPGKFSYALPNKAENTLNVVYLQESNVCIIATKNYGFDVKVPQRIYHFRLLESTENREEEYSAWIEAFNKACSMKRSSLLVDDLDQKNKCSETNPPEKDVQTADEGVADDSNRLTLMVPPGEKLNVLKKPTRPGTKRPTRRTIRNDAQPLHTLE